MKPTPALSLSITLSAIVVLAQQPQPPTNLKLNSMALVTDDSIIPIPINGPRVQYSWPHTNGVWIVEGGSGAPDEFAALSEAAQIPIRAVRQANTASYTNSSRNEFNPFPPVWLGWRRAEVPTNIQIRVVQLRKIATRP